MAVEIGNEPPTVKAVLPPPARVRVPEAVELVVTVRELLPVLMTKVEGTVRETLAPPRRSP